MSYPGTRETAKADARAADMQIDGLETSETSPVRDGGSSATVAGAAPLNGEKEFTTKRTRHTDTMVKGMRREFPAEGVPNWGSK
jgi:hypothetical protein